MPARPLLQPSCSSFAPRLLALAVGVSLLTGSIPALAAPPKGEEEVDPTETRAMNAYREGQEAYDAGEYSKALELFLEAQSLYPSPDFHYNIAKCHEALENYEQALVSYKAYLRSYNSAYGEDPDDKVNIDNKIERLEKQIEAEKAADEAARNKEPEVIIKEVPGEKKKTPGQGMIIAGGVLTGVGVGAAIVGAAVYGPRASNVSNQLDEVYSGNPDRLTLEDARALDAVGRNAELNQILMISLGSAFAVTGVALIVVGVMKKKKGAKETPTVAPAVGPESAGLFVTGRF
jgi:tetratricopeptide (TPR) repeat protein